MDPDQEVLAAAESQVNSEKRTMNYRRKVLKMAVKIYAKLANLVLFPSHKVSM